MASLSARLQAARAQKRDFSPVSWRKYFDEAHDITIDNQDDQREQTKSTTQTESKDSFRVYLRNFTSPLAPKRQFGQRSTRGNTNEISQEELNQYSQYPTIVTLHGGGYSALSWAQFTHCIEQHCKCRILAIDLRGHGDTKTTDDEKMDIDTLVSDVIQVTHKAHELCGFSETPKVILVGHSMGGAIAVKCSMRCLESMPSLAGFVIIDVVEGTAKDALPLMMSVINTRPSKFVTLENAIEWSVRSGMAKNSDAARVSMPGNLLNISTGHLSIHDIEDKCKRLRQDDGATSATNDCNQDGILADTTTTTTAAATSTPAPDTHIRRHKFHISLEHLIKQPASKIMSSALPTGLRPMPARIAALRGSPLAAGLPPIPQRQQISSESVSELDEESSSAAPPESSDKLEEQTINKSRSDDGPDGADDEVDSAPVADHRLDGDGYKRPPELDQSGYCWRTDLAKTQPYWAGWFEGLSEQLLTAPVQGKFLLLAGIDRLDRTLTIGQMQGKFMMKVLPKCGHAVHEDVPDQVASVIGQFLVRNKFTTSTSVGTTTDS